MAADIAALLSKALERRQQLIAIGEPCRLFDGSGDGLSGLHVDRYGECLLVHLFNPEITVSRLEEPLVKALSQLQPETIYLRMHGSDARENAGAQALLLYGKEIEELAVSEHGIRYVVKPASQVNAGLFLDMREVRRYFKKHSAGLKVLNTFCFTGSLGLSCFAGGAREVVQVDISKSVINWAKQNHELNSALGKGEVRFITEDARTFMKRELRRRERGGDPYDLVIVDPPAFSSSKNKKFSLKNELGELIALAKGLLKEDGGLFISTNMKTITIADLEEGLCSVIVNLEKGALKRFAPPSIDFPAESESSGAMKAVLAQLE